ISKEGPMLHCVVEDNGVGQNQASLQGFRREKKSLGLKITRSRIEILNKIKKSQASVELSDLPGGTRVDLRLPLEYRI
ncbi:MAG TPA: ATP-binding protein, partial [Chitinophagaceae bacterium]|nr:ATP-binding protein [Chitinophagaceae bacterium]